MKNYLFKLTCLFSIVLLLISCSTIDEIKEEQNQEIKKNDTTSEKFYAEYKIEIQKLDRVEFVGLNPKIKRLAYREFSSRKKADWWFEKLNNVEKNADLTKEQIIFLDEVKSKVSADLFDKKAANIDELASYVQTEGIKVGFDFQSLKNIFTELNDVDNELHLVNYIDKKSDSKEIGTEIALKGLKKIISNNEISIGDINALNIDPQPYDYFCGETCFWCFPGTRCEKDCTSNGTDCGLFGDQKCNGVCKY